MAASSSNTNSRSNTTLMALTYDDHAILAVDSRMTRGLFHEVDPKDYKKFLKPYPDAYIYLGFCGSSRCMEVLQARLPQWCAGRTPPNNLEEAMRAIRQYINDTYSRRWAKDGIDVDIVVVGAIQPDEPFGIYMITKGTGTRRYKSRKVRDHKICIGSGSRVLNGNYMDACHNDFTVKNSSKYALEGVKLAIRQDWGSGGAINLIQIRRDSSVECVYKQNNPRLCTDDYLLRSRTRL